MEIINFIKKADKAKFTIRVETDPDKGFIKINNINYVQTKGKYSSFNEIMNIMGEYFSEEVAKIELRKVGLCIYNDGKVASSLSGGEQGFNVDENTKYLFLIDEPDKKLIKVTLIGEYGTKVDFYYQLKKIQERWIIVYIIESVLTFPYRNGWVATTSSSELYENGRYYDAHKAVDKKLETAWVEGIPGDGIGEWIDFLFYPKQEIKAISIINGYVKNELTYQANNRLKRVKISFDDGVSFETELKDGQMQAQMIELPEPKNVEQFRITILEVYNGTKYKDTCISEVDFQ